jgi:hypothetical protein
MTDALHPGTTTRAFFDDPARLSELAWHNDNGNNSTQLKTSTICSS